MDKCYLDDTKNAACPYVVLRHQRKKKALVSQCENPCY